MTTLMHPSPNLRPVQSPSLYNGLSSTPGVPMAALTGISGDKWYGFDKGGPDPIKISKEWIKDHIQIGPLGSVTSRLRAAENNDSQAMWAKVDRATLAL
ncbi:hypothetical protein AnigIFM56816_010471 [Aspergillus niger]|nr:hypothetical protein AnigIFM56816_010471 [Aspergillus niger]